MQIIKLNSKYRIRSRQTSAYLISKNKYLQLKDNKTKHIKYKNKSINNNTYYKLIIAVIQKNSNNRTILKYNRHSKE